MAVDKNVCGVQQPVFLSFNIENASTTSANVVTILGRIPTEGIASGGEISGLSIHPLTGELYALFRHGGSGAADNLIIVHKTNGNGNGDGNGSGNLVQDIVTMTGLGQQVGSGEELVFDSLGNLYVTDNADDHLYQVDPNTAEIIAVLDDDQPG